MNAAQKSSVSLSKVPSGQSSDAFGNEASEPSAQIFSSSLERPPSLSRAFFYVFIAAALMAMPSTLNAILGDPSFLAANPDPSFIALAHHLTNFSDRILTPASLLIGMGFALKGGILFKEYSAIETQSSSDPAPPSEPLPSSSGESFSAPPSTLASAPLAQRVRERQRRT